MPAPRPRSLRRWLTRWLAILTFAGLGLVCVAVYWATNRNLSIRQEALLAQKMEVIRHLVEENAAKGDSASLRHKLEDFFYGRPDFSLALEIDGARVVYGGPGDGEAGHGRHINFALPVPGSPGAPSNPARWSTTSRKPRSSRMEAACSERPPDLQPTTIFASRPKRASMTRRKSRFGAMPIGPRWAIGTL